jgi:YVTN family beta-propeller protein
MKRQWTPQRHPRTLAAVALAACVGLLAACGSSSAPVNDGARQTGGPAPSVAPSDPTPSDSATPTAADLLPGMPAPLSPTDVYAADGPGMLSPAVAGDPYRIYVPNSESNTVTVIDPSTYRVLGTYRVGRQPQHVVPSWDLRTLWVNDDLGNSLTPIDPRTGRFGRPVRVPDPYNLYFTPNGRSAVVMASALRRIDFRDPHTMALQRSVHVPCLGVNHADWTADGRFFLVSCEFSGQLLWVSTAAQRVLRVIDLGAMAKPQDVKLSPDGRYFYVADMMTNGVWEFSVGRDDPRLVRFLHTGKGAHGLYVSRDSRYMYISNRDEGTISVFDFATRRLVAKWPLGPGASPDMGNVSPDGKVLWLSGRYSGVVYAISTANGRLLARIRVGSQPHGLCVWPQPGRYSLGHTGIMR